MEQQREKFTIIRMEANQDTQKGFSRGDNKKRKDEMGCGGQGLGEKIRSSALKGASESRSLKVHSNWEM